MQTMGLKPSFFKGFTKLITTNAKARFMIIFKRIWPYSFGMLQYSSFISQIVTTNAMHSKYMWGRDIVKLLYRHVIWLNNIMNK